jgi:hypothetical protein
MTTGATDSTAVSSTLASPDGRGETGPSGARSAMVDVPSRGVLDGAGPAIIDVPDAVTMRTRTLNALGSNCLSGFITASSHGTYPL